MSSLKIAIIGGSIAGCATAITLQRLHHDVMVFEQSPGELESRGAGVCIDRELHRRLVAQDYIDVDMPYTELKSRPFFDALSGRLLWEQPINALAINWGILYKNLHQRVNHESYYQAAKVIKIIQKIDHIIITLDNGHEFEVDLLICCDGFYSLGRRFLFSDQRVQSVGYIAWRGLIPTSEIDLDSYWQQIPYFGYPFGHMLLYRIPNQTKKGEYLVNWLIYQRVTPEEIQRFFTDFQGNFHEYSLPPGKMSSENQSYLLSLSDQYFSPVLANMVHQTTKPFIQHIYEMNLTSLWQNRVILLGDAGILARPHVASGTIKALDAAFLLGVILQQKKSLEEALMHWNQQRLAIEQRLFTMGQSFGRALVGQTPPWGQMTADNMVKWWNAAIDGKQWYATNLSSEFIV